MSIYLEDKYSPVVVEELLKGQNDWKNIQDIIKLSIRALADVLRVQGNTIRELERQMPNKLNKEDFFHEMSKKVDGNVMTDQINETKREIRASLAETNLKITEKVSLESLQFLLGDKVSKENFEFFVLNNQQEMNKSYEELYRKIVQVEKRKNSMEKDVEDIRKEVKKKVDMVEVEEMVRIVEGNMNSTISSFKEAFIQDLSSKTPSIQFQTLEKSFKDLENLTQLVQKELATLKNSYQTEMTQKIDVKDFKQFTETYNLKSENLKELNTKMTISIDTLKDKYFDLEKAQYTHYSDIQKTNDFLAKNIEKTSKFNERLCLDMEKIFKDVEFLKHFVEDLSISKANADEMIGKIEFVQIMSELGKKVNEEIFYNSLQRLQESLLEKTAIKDFQDLSQHLQLLQQDTIDKGSFKDICSLLDKKANIEEVNIALLSIHNELDTKVQDSDFKQAFTKHSMALSSLCNENIIGRWLWQSGQLQRSNSIPWEKQLVNTSPENFIWEPNGNFIFVSRSGYYEISIGIFQGRKPNIQVLVNGEVVLSAVNNSQFSSNNSVGMLKTGAIAGVTFQEFISLPQRSRISIFCSNEYGEGFLSLRRL